MPLITKVAPQKKASDRFNVFVDGKYSFAVSLDVLLQFKLKERAEISENDLKKILSEESFSKLYSKALSFISYQNRTRKEVWDKLSRILCKTVDDKREREDIIDKILTRIETAGFVDDSNYARLYIQNALTLKSPPSRYKIKEFLKRKGVNPELITVQMEDYTPENEDDSAKVAFNKKIKQLGGISELKDPKVKAKIWRFMAGRGYSADTIKSLFDTIPQVY
ncbi:RecX family transcriptional regulator [candidate division WWE3 bacterium]|nr:RecX family transcriptional regulator [candidate division WWE3 bacterium]